MNEYLSYLKEQMTTYQNEEKILIETDRKDEANLAKIKANMCGICMSMYPVAAKKGDAEAVKEEYFRLLDRLLDEWTAAYEKAKEHDEVEKILVEETKLTVMKELKQKYVEFEV